MKDKLKSPSTQKSSPEEVQAWLDSVHFGSCCSDSIDIKDNQTCKLTNKKTGPKNQQSN